VLSVDGGEAELADAIRDMSDWLNRRALPYWSSVGVDGRHGFVEHMTLDARPAEVDFKRLRVQARQVYVFSHAYINGYGPGLDAAANGWAFIRDHGWVADGNWARVLGRHGGILDPTADLYDHAFALLGIAWWIRASGEDALGWAERTLEAIDLHLSTADGVGWWSEEGPGSALLQNPHMHLLEGCLATYAATGAAPFKRYAERIISLFESRLFDSATGTLAENFDDHWCRQPGPGGCIVEPGHHYEWVWLLCSAAHWIPNADEHVEALFDFAERLGCAPETGLVYDQVLEDGSPVMASHRLWPNTEALKAHLARFELGGTLDRERVRRILKNVLAYYLGLPTPETWIDQLDVDLLPSVNKIPTSSMYHIHLAIAEIERLEPALRAGGVLTK
jgi:mannose/cellobiose epimerase-like protein (N-acyl-D-glucosamine 2-epimerase family)